MSKEAIFGGNNDGNQNPNPSPSPSHDGNPNPNSDDNVLTIGDETFNLDSDGNAIDDSGKVIKTKDELESLKNPNEPNEPNESNTTQVEIEGEVYDLNENGDAVDKDGKVIYSADDIKEMEEETPPFDINKIAQATNIQITDANGNIVEYENTEEGLQKYVEDVFKIGLNTGSKSETDKLFSTYKWLPDLLKHVQLGGSLEDFTSHEDFNNIELKQDNEAQLKSIIFKARKERGDTDDSIERYYNYLKSLDDKNDAVFKEAETELSYLKKVDANKKADMDAKLAAQKQAQQEQLLNYWGVEVDEQGNLINKNINDSVYSKIINRKLLLNDSEFVIPDKIRVVDNGKVELHTPEDFFKYLYEPIVVNIDGQQVQTTRDNLKLMQEQQNRKVDNDIYDAFLRYVNYDKTQLITEQVKQENVKRIKKLSKKKLNGGSRNNEQNNQNSNKTVVFK